MSVNDFIEQFDKGQPRGIGDTIYAVHYYGDSGAELKLSELKEMALTIETLRAQAKQLAEALEKIADIDKDYDTKLVGHYLLKSKCKVIAKEALSLAREVLR